MARKPRFRRPKPPVELEKLREQFFREAEKEARQCREKPDGRAIFSIYVVGGALDYLGKARGIPKKTVQAAKMAEARNLRAILARVNAQVGRKIKAKTVKVILGELIEGLGELIEGSDEKSGAGFTATQQQALEKARSMAMDEQKKLRKIKGEELINPPNRTMLAVAALVQTRFVENMLGTHGGEYAGLIAQALSKAR